MSYYMKSDIGVMNEGNQQFNLGPLFHYPLIRQESRESFIVCFHQRNAVGLGFLIYHVTSLNQIVLTEQVAKKAHTLE